VIYKKQVTVEQALQKLKHFCGYQERSHHETQQKLYSLGLYKKDVDTLLSQLIEENYLNEERYANAFASGRFRIKQWGRIKIKYEMQQHKVSIYNITKAIQSIDETDYLATLQTLAEKKWNSLKSEQYLNRQTKTIHFLMQRGFEPNLIAAAIAKIRNIYKIN
jgi:regulatory protein